MDFLAFTVPGAARGKGRPRATTIGGHARMFTDSKTASYENLVRMAAEKALGSRKPFDEPVHVSVRVRVQPPGSASKKATAAMLAGEIMPAKKPDLTNILKAVEDGANTVAFRDDSLIVRLLAFKTYAETAGVDVVVRAARAATTETQDHAA